MMAAGMDPAVIAERLQHSDGGALLLKKYNHLYPAQKRVQLPDWMPLSERSRTQNGQRSPMAAENGLTKGIRRMGATGLEPVTPSLSRWSDGDPPGSGGRETPLG